MSRRMLPYLRSPCTTELVQMQSRLRVGCQFALTPPSWLGCLSSLIWPVRFASTPPACMTYMVQMRTGSTPLQSAEARSGHSMVALLLGGRQKPAVHERVERAGEVCCLSGRRIVVVTCPASDCSCFSASLHWTSVVFITSRAGSVNAALLARGIIWVCLGGRQMDGPACLRVGSCATASQPSRLWPWGASLVREGEWLARQSVVAHLGSSPADSNVGPMRAGSQPVST